MNKKEYLESKKGEAVMLTCVRFYYRGIVADVGDDGVLLSHPTMVFEESSYTTVKPKEEYPIPSDLWVAFDSIESICQPTWCFYGYETTK